MGSRKDMAASAVDPAVYRAPIMPGEGVAHWQLGRREETRYDLPFTTMKGEMDPLFFLASEKNVIPHEYPCRTAFAAGRRGRRPEPALEFRPDGWWFGFGSPRLDLSGFWFRPTVIEGRARSGLHSPRAQTVRVRLETCGGAILWVGDREIGHVSGYRRNAPTAAEFDFALPAGTTPLEIWFDDLCERDARVTVELRLLTGEDLEVALPVDASPATAIAIESLLAGIRFERSFYGGGEVALLLPEPSPFPVEAAIAISGDFISGERQHRHLAVAAGETRLSLGQADDLPADFRHFSITLAASGFALSRPLAVEICHLERHGPVPGDLAGRVGECLDHVAAGGEPDTVTALARLATGQDDATTLGMLCAALPAIRDCHDCADFALVPLLWARMRFADRLDPVLRETIDDAVLGFRYWMDEPGNDVMWWFSENHALLFHAACHLAGHLFPDRTFPRSGRTGTRQEAIGRDRLHAWFDAFEAHEMAEWNSAPYFPIDLKGFAALFVLSPDAKIRARAGRAIHRLLEIVARSAHHGMLTASQGRSYEHTLCASRSLEISGLSRLVFARGWYGRRVHCLPLIALAIRDHGLAPDPALAPVACWDRDEDQEWRFCQGRGGVARLYHYKTRHTAMGSAAGFKPGGWGYQETLLHVRIGREPEAACFVSHPGEAILFGHGRPSYWGGSGTVPRVHQYRNLAVVAFDLHEGLPGFTHAWLPQDAFDEVHVADDRVVARAGRGLLMLAGSAPLAAIAEGPMADCEIRLDGRRTWWIVRLSDLDRDVSLASFRSRFASLTVRTDDETIIVNDPDYGAVAGASDGLVSAEGRTLDPAAWTLKGDVSRRPSDLRLRKTDRRAMKVI